MKSIFIPRYFWNGTNDEVCTNTAVLVRDNRIEQIDEPEKLRLGYPEAQVLESKDWLMMPAFVDAHDHGRGMSPISFRTPDRALEMWLQDLNKLPAIPHYQACYYDGMRLVSSGVGMVLHMHLNMVCTFICIYWRLSIKQSMQSVHGARALLNIIKKSGFWAHGCPLHMPYGWMKKICS